MALLEVKELRTYFYTRHGIHKAVDGVSFSVAAGETLGLVGESGSGKSVTCLSILGLAPKPTARVAGGQVLFEGEDLLRKSERQLRAVRGRQIAMILQDPFAALNPVFNIRFQVGEALRTHRGVHGRALAADIVRSLQEVGVPEPATRLADYPHQFSGGMRQRVVGAIAISCRPKLLIADEPTTSLDATIQAQYLNLLADLRRDLGLSVILVTHDFGIVATMCDRVAVMYAGSIVEQGSVTDIFDRPSHPYTAALLKSVPSVDQRPSQLYSIAGQPGATLDSLPGCRFAPRCPYVLDPCRQRVPPMIELAPGHASACFRAAETSALARGGSSVAIRADPAQSLAAAAPTTTDAVVRAQSLVKTFTLSRGSLLARKVELRAVDGVSFELPPAHTFSLVGESGCGKSTTARMILRLERPTSGQVAWDGADVWQTEGDTLLAYRRTVQGVFQDPFSSMNPRIRIGGFIGEPLLMDRSLTPADRQGRVAEALVQVGLRAGDAALFPHEFSGGQRQRMAVARALVCSPKVIVLDEPVSALDVSIRAQIMNLLKDLQDRLGIGYLLIAHHLGTVRYLSHEMAVMYLGRIVEIGPSESLFGRPLHPYTRALIAAALPARAGAKLAEPVKGETPDLTQPQLGCRFAPRCAYAQPLCREADPPLRELASGRGVACHFAETLPSGAGWLC
ncbi:MAG TPA: ABC transporter ATP-binding protein [Chloroflexota bacterium]|nr:ABC transporter ATP-binding protein [Chloroflexota bacterium]